MREFGSLRWRQIFQRRCQQRIPTAGPAAGQLDLIAGSEIRIGAIVVGRDELSAGIESGLHACVVVLTRFTCIGVGARANKVASSYKVLDVMEARDRFVDDAERCFRPAFSCITGCLTSM